MIDGVVIVRGDGCGGIFPVHPENESIAVRTETSTAHVGEYICGMADTGVLDEQGSLRGNNGMR